MDTVCYFTTDMSALRPTGYLLVGYSKNKQTHTQALRKSVVEAVVLPYWSKFLQSIYEVSFHHSLTQTPDMNHWTGRDTMRVFSIVLQDTQWTTVTQYGRINIMLDCNKSGTTT